MKYLLDTHIFLWFAAGDEKLSATARKVIEDPDAVLLLSDASVWEISADAVLDSYGVSRLF